MENKILETIGGCPFCLKSDELVITHIYDGEDYIGCRRCHYDGVHIDVWKSRSETIKPKKVDYFVQGYYECVWESCWQVAKVLPAVWSKT